MRFQVVPTLPAWTPANRTLALSRLQALPSARARFAAGIWAVVVTARDSAGGESQTYVTESERACSQVQQFSTQKT